MRVRPRRSGRNGATVVGCRWFPLSRDFSLDVFQCVTPVSVEIWMSERPALRTNTMSEIETSAKGSRAYVLAELVVIGIFHLVKVVLV